MPDDGNQGQGQPGGAQGGAGDGGTQQQPTGQQQGAQGQPNADDARAQALETQLATARRELEQTQAKLREREQADLSVQERLQRDLEERNTKLSALEASHRSLRVQVAAAKVGIRADATAAAAALLDWSKIEDASDDKQLERAVRELAKEHPYLSAGGTNIDQGVSGGRARTGDMNDLIRSAVGRR